MKQQTGSKNIVVNVINGGPGSGPHTHKYVGSPSQQFKPGTKGYATGSGRSLWFSTDAPNGSGAYVHSSDVKKIK